MAIASLSRFTVPLASDQSGTAQGLLMPKLKYRFRVTLLNFGVNSPTTELSKQVMDFKRPVATFENIQLDVYNSKVNLAGKPTWSDTTLQVRDDVTGTVSKLVGEQIQKQFDFYEQASAAAGGDYKFLTKCEMLDGGNGADQPVVLETWELYGCYVKVVDYGSLDYKANEIATITMTIQFDNAIQMPLKSGIGGHFRTRPTGGSQTTGVGQP
jgi:hypothetical protein